MHYRIVGPRDTRPPRRTPTPFLRRFGLRSSTSALVISLLAAGLVGSGANAQTPVTVAPEYPRMDQIPPPTYFQSVKRMEAYIKARKAEAKAAALKHKAKDKDQDKDRDRDREEAEHHKGPHAEPPSTGGGDKDDVPGLDYIEAYKYRYKQRAFPHDTINMKSIPAARAQVQSMPTPSNARGGGKAVNTPPPVVNGWQFVGPSKLTGATTAEFGQAYITGRVNALAFDPTDSNTFFLGAASGGLWKTTNAGATWTPLSDTWPSLEISCITFDPTTPKTIYVGTGDFDGSGVNGVGIMKSVDGGNTWTNMGSDLFTGMDISAIVVDPDYPNIVTVAIGRGFTNVPGIYQSTDGGYTWHLAPFGIIEQGIVLYDYDAAHLTYLDFSDLAISAKNPQTGQRTYYAAACDDFYMDVALFSSVGRGAIGTWTKLSPPTKAADQNMSMAKIATSPSSPTVAYFGSGAQQFPPPNSTTPPPMDNNVWELTGTTFSSLINPGSYMDYNAFPENWAQPFYDFHLSVSESTSVQQVTDAIYAGLVDLDLYSTFPTEADGQVRFGWNSIGGPSYSEAAAIHVDHHAVAINPKNSSDVLIGNDGGVYRMTFNSAAQTWSIQNLNLGLGITQIYRAAFHPTNPNYMLEGSQDNGTGLSAGNPYQWTGAYGGDGGFCIINPLNPEVQYTTADGDIIKTSNAWKTGTDITPVLFEQQTLVPPLTYDAKHPNLIYAASYDLFQYNAVTNSWNGPLGPPETLSPLFFTVTYVAVAPTDTNRIYTASLDGFLYMSTDQGKTWRNIGGSLPQLSFTYIAVNPANENSILVGFSGDGAATGHLWQCTNTINHNPVWRNVSATAPDGLPTLSGLPDISLNAIALDIDHPNTSWYVGTDMGVFLTINAGQSWINVGAPLGLPNVEVDDLHTVPGTRYLEAATYGRGLWRLKLFPGELVPGNGQYGE